MGKCGGNELNYVSDVDVIFVAAGDDDLTAGTTRRHPADRDLRAGRLAGRRGAAPRGQPRPAGPHAGQPPGLLPALGPHVGVPGAAQGPAGRRRPRRWRRSGSTTWRRWSGTRPSARRRSRTSARCAAGSSTTCRPARWSGRSSAGRAGCATSSSRCSCCSSCTAGSTRRCACRARCRRCARWSPAATWAGPDGETLLRGYRFLRTVEHRLQLQDLRRTHTVPADPAGAALAGRRAGLHRPARPRRRRVVPRRLGRRTPARSAGCTSSCSTGRCWRRSPGCRPRRCG